MNDKSQSPASSVSGRSRVFERKYWTLLIILAVILGCLFLIFPQSLLHPFRCELSTSPTHYQASNGIFVDNLMIVTGVREDVEAVIGTPQDPRLPVRLIEGCDLSYLNTRDNPNPSLTEEQRKSLVLQLYEVQPGQEISLEDVIGQINSTRGDNEQGPERYIYADPNYLTSLAGPGSGSCGYPFSGGGSPFSGGGSPFSGGGSPFSGGGSPYYGPGIAGEDGEDDFIQQWAFGSQGINYPASPQSTGRNVRVAIFDTSPFRDNRVAYNQITKALPSAFTLPSRNALGPDIMSNHGLFVAGLIHKIAPQSRIELIRVLNDFGCGDLWQITKALNDYTGRASAWTGNLNKVVINMSLGVHVPDEAHKKEYPDTDWAELDEEVHSLKAAIDEVYGKGAIIVAAAGNDSAPPPDDPSLPPQPMQIPASYENVIGVAATNMSGNRSCYSNAGDVMAPGGDGGIYPSDPTFTCVSRANTWDTPPGPGSSTSARCTDMASCDFGVISLLISADQNGRWVYGYGLWSGTSFSTPLVSGLASLAYQKETQQNVTCLIENGASLKYRGATSRDPVLGWGAIDVTRSLSDAGVLSSCGVKP